MQDPHPNPLPSTGEGIGNKPLPSTGEGIGKNSGVLLINLGTPRDPSVGAVRSYLREFLSDPRVVDLPGLIRGVLLNCVILPFRPARAAKAYQKIWRQDGSPLMIYSQELATKLTQRLHGKMQVALGMRYGEPSIKSALQSLQHQGCDHITILPLFPQYSSAASGSAIAAALQILSRAHDIPNLKVISDFFEHPAYINALAAVATAPIAAFKPDHLLMSYHGLPERQVARSQIRFNYRNQCFASSLALAAKLGLKLEQYSVAFQSRLGRIPWIKPYTDEVLPILFANGVRRLAVICPSFTADCLETLEEINMAAREQWLRLGGEDFCYIPCVNADEAWVEAVVEIVS